MTIEQAVDYIEERFGLARDYSLLHGWVTSGRLPATRTATGWDIDERDLRLAVQFYIDGGPAHMRVTARTGTLVPPSLVRDVEKWHRNTGLYHMKQGHLAGVPVNGYRSYVTLPSYRQFRPGAYERCVGSVSHIGTAL